MIDMSASCAGLDSASRTRSPERKGRLLCSAYTEIKLALAAGISRFYSLLEKKEHLLSVSLLQRISALTVPDPTARRRDRGIA